MQFLQKNEKRPLPK